MANENKKTNELVSDDDDPTAEFEVLSLRREDSSADLVESESDADTYGFSRGDSAASAHGQSIPELQSDLRTRSKTIGRLQFDIEQLRAKWLGLETEISAREEIVNNLNRDVDNLKDIVSRKDKLLKKRDLTIKSLKSDINQRGKEHEALVDQLAEREQQLSDQRSIEKDNLEALETAASGLEKLQSEIDSSRDEADHLRAKSVGLETEIKDYEDLTGKLSSELDELSGSVSRKDTLLKTRESAISDLNSEIERRDEERRSLARQYADIEQKLNDQRRIEKDNLEALERTTRDFENLQADFDSMRARAQSEAESLIEQKRSADLELLNRVSRTEEYADVLRHKLQDLIEVNYGLQGDNDSLALTLVANQQLSSELGSASQSIAALQAALEQQQSDHEQEIRTLRFELGEVNNTVTQAGEISNQLASDLVDTRSLKDELEQTLSKNAEQAQKRIEELENDLNKLSGASEDFEQKLEAKSKAIDVLLGELEKKSEQIESIGNIEDVIHDIDGWMSERFDSSVDSEVPGPTPAQANCDRERTTRLLIGNIDEQELRFPLFKDRLTIGRIEENDIQLKGTYISRRHAVIQTEGDRTRIVDWGSKNGVFVNSTRITEHVLSNGDIVSIGNAKFRYEERPKRAP